jgi:hypothetical protein
MAESACGDACRNEHGFNVTEGDNANQSNHMNGNALFCFTEQFYRTKRRTRLIWNYISSVPSYVEFKVLHYSMDKAE